MKEVSYNDPYEAPVYVQIEDDDAEGLEEVLCFLNENADRLRKDERNYCKKIPYRIEANIYEGMDYASGEDVAKEAMEQFEKQIIDKWLSENLTEAQYRRFRLLMQGCSIREIARREECDFSSANESIKAAQKKLQKIWQTSPIKMPAPKDV